MSFPREEVVVAPVLPGLTGVRPRATHRPVHRVIPPVAVVEPVVEAAPTAGLNAVGVSTALARLRTPQQLQAYLAFARGLGQAGAFTSFATHAQGRQFHRTQQQVNLALFGGRPQAVTALMGAITATADRHPLAELIRGRLQQLGLDPANAEHRGRIEAHLGRWVSDGEVGPTSALLGHLAVQPGPDSALSRADQWLAALRTASGNAALSIEQLQTPEGFGAMARHGGVPYRPPAPTVEP